MFETLISIITNRIFIFVYLTICYSMINLGLKTLKPLVQKNQADIDRDEKYIAFKRNDMHKISHFLCYLTAPFILIKFCIGWF